MRARALGLRRAQQISRRLLLLGETLGLFAGLLPSARAQDRTVNFYNWSDYVAPGVLEDFTRETGIKVVYDTFDANETLETNCLPASPATTWWRRPPISCNARSPRMSSRRSTHRSCRMKNAWDFVTGKLALSDPGNQFAANYMWGTTGIGYNVAAVKKILGDGAAIDSWGIVFTPDTSAKFKDCGVHMLIADDILPAALNYLGLDPNSTKKDDLERAAELVGAVRPYVRKFHSSEYLNALATGEICLVVGWSGDIKQAQARAAEANNGVEIGYAIRRRARRCSSTIWRFPPTPGTSPKRTN